VRDGEKGPVAIEMVTRRIQTRLERKRTGPEEWLVVTRRLLTEDRTLEPRASRDATDQDERYRYHYYLSSTCVSEAELARVIKAGVCIEIYQSCNLHKTLFCQKIAPCVASLQNKSCVRRSPLVLGRRATGRVRGALSGPLPSPVSS
jgi:hypothetical protein